MRKWLEHLAAICCEYPIAEKVLILPERSDGHQVLEALARNGIPWLNLRVHSPLSLAREILEEHQTEAFQIAESGQCLAILEEILAEKSSSNGLDYFSLLYDKGCLPEILLPSLNELRLAGIVPSEVIPNAFVSAVKGREISQIYGQYVQALELNRLLDSAATFRLANQLLDEGKWTGRPMHLIVPAQMDFPYLGYKFIQSLSARASFHVLPEEPVISLKIDRQFCFEGPEVKAQSRFSYLFELNGLSDTVNKDLSLPNVDIFRAYGRSAEVTEVLRLLRTGGRAFDEAVLAYTHSSYIPLIHNVMSVHGIQATYAEGLPVAGTRPGRLTLGLIDWVHNNYRVDILAGLLDDGVFNIPNCHGIARTILESGIAWGRERYVQWAQKTTDDSAKELLNDLLNSLPDPRSSHIDDLLKGLQIIVNKYTDDSRYYDRAAAGVIDDAIAQMAPFMATLNDNTQSALWLRQYLDSLYCGGQNPVPGQMHVCSWQQAEMVFRENLYIIGLDEGCFPGRGRPDPVLLNSERGQIDSRLKERGREGMYKNYRLARLLAGHQGPVNLGYCSYDLKESRLQQPSPILLQVHRLLQNNPQLNYSDLQAALGDAADFTAAPGREINRMETWMDALRHGVNGDAFIPRMFPYLKQGMGAEEQRSSDLFTAFDGIIQVDAAQSDPRQNDGLVMSATSLEELAKCPFRYFISKILKIEPVEEPDRDLSIWLDALQRGALLHDIYCQYGRRIYSPGSAHQPSPGDLHDIAITAIETIGQEITPPSQLAYETEKNALLQGLQVFYRLLTDMDSDYEPSYFEVPFGCGPEESAKAGLGLDEPVSIQLPDGRSFKLRGYIDRIDRAVKGTAYRVWDYKTGGTYGYKEEGNVQHGALIQHLLYAIAAEAVLKAVDQSARVDKAGYIFSTAKGEGQVIERNQALREDGLKAVAYLLDILAEGRFSTRDDDNQCKYCDYQDVCGYPDAPARAAMKFENLTSAEPWKELKEIG